MKKILRKKMQNIPKLPEGYTLEFVYRQGTGQIVVVATEGDYVSFFYWDGVSADKYQRVDICRMEKTHE